VRIGLDGTSAVFVIVPTLLSLYSGLQGCIHSGPKLPNWTQNVGSAFVLLSPFTVTTSLEMRNSEYGKHIEHKKYMSKKDA
jgi:hypothetical protein